MAKSLVIVLLAALVSLSLAGYASHDVTYHPGYGGYGHGVSVRHDYRHPGYHAYAAPLPYAYGGAAYAPAYGHGYYGGPLHYW